MRLLGPAWLERRRRPPRAVSVVPRRDGYARIRTSGLSVDRAGRRWQRVPRGLTPSRPSPSSSVLPLNYIPPRVPQDIGRTKLSVNYSAPPVVEFAPMTTRSPWTHQGTGCRGVDAPGVQSCSAPRTNHTRGCPVRRPDPRLDDLRDRLRWYGPRRLRSRGRRPSRSAGHRRIGTPASSSPAPSSRLREPIRYPPTAGRSR